MLFPNTIPQMKLLDRIKVFAPLIGGTGTTIIKIIGAAAISLFAALMIAVAFLGYAVKTFFGFLRVKEKYQGTLVSNLYFNSLDNNAGVIHHLIESRHHDLMRVQRLKKRKLKLKDMITRLESELIPDIDA